MEKDLIYYIISYCREFMTDEEIKALRRVTMSEIAIHESKENFELEKFYGFKNDEVNFLVSLGEENLQEKIAQRIFDKYQKTILNNCPKCTRLARTPKAKQCRFCFYDWH